MMNKKKTSIFASGKYLFTVLLIGGLLLANCSFGNNNSSTINDRTIESVLITKIFETDDDNTPFATAEKMPSFPGGEKALIEFIKNNLKYPADAQEKKIEGHVTVRFVVSKTGAIKDVEVLLGIYPSCDAEAIRVINSMPNWTPGVKNGKLVDVYYTLPITFRLK